MLGGKKTVNTDTAMTVIKTTFVPTSSCSITMDNTGPVSVSTHKSVQRKFFQWLAKWYYNDQTDNISVKPDAPELACLLQAIGFQLREFEKHEDPSGESKTKDDSLTVIIECGSSKMRAIMELTDITCQCPNQDDAKDASFWSVSGTGPLGSMENMNKVVETGSNLLPSVSKGVTNVLRDVTQHLFRLIKNIPDVNQNTDSNQNLSAIKDSIKPPSTNNEGIALIRRHTQPDFNTGRCRSLDTLTKGDNEADNVKPSPSPLITADLPMPRSRTASDSCQKKTLWNKPSVKDELDSAVDLMVSYPISSASFPAALQRQKTFDMDIETSSTEGEPRPSPPKISSSPVPVPQLCTSLGQISLQSDGKDLPLIDMLFKAKTNLERALRMLNNRSPSSDIISDDIFLKPPPPRNSSFRISPGSNSRPGSNCSLPINPTSRNSSLQKSSVRRNVATSFKKNSDGLKSPADKKSTPAKGSLLQRRSLGARLPSPRPLSLKVDTPRPGTSGAPSNSGSGSRVIIAAKRRVSPDPKSNSAHTPRSSSAFLNTSTSKTGVGSQKSQSNISLLKSVPGCSVNKFGFVKK